MIISICDFIVSLTLVLQNEQYLHYFNVTISSTCSPQGTPIIAHTGWFRSFRSPFSKLQVYERLAFNELMYTMVSERIISYLGIEKEFMAVFLWKKKKAFCFANLE